MRGIVRSPNKRRQCRHHCTWFTARIYSDGGHAPLWGDQERECQEVVRSHRHTIQFANILDSIYWLWGWTLDGTFRQYYLCRKWPAHSRKWHALSRSDYEREQEYRVHIWHRDLLLWLQSLLPNDSTTYVTPWQNTLSPTHPCLDIFKAL